MWHSGIEWTGRDNVYCFVQLILDGILTGKNLFPVGEQSLSCKSTTPCSGSKLCPLKNRLSCPFHSIPFQSVLNNAVSGYLPLIPYF